MIKILVLEDDLSSRELLCNLLTQQGYEVVCEADGCSGFLQIGKQQPDLVISDIDMPGMSGLEILHRLRLDQATNEIPFIICTNAIEEVYCRLAAKLDAAYITKPVYPETILQTIAEQLARRSEV